MVPARMNLRIPERSGFVSTNRSSGNRLWKTEPADRAAPIQRLPGMDRKTGHREPAVADKAYFRERLPLAPLNISLYADSPIDFTPSETTRHHLARTSLGPDLEEENYRQPRPMAPWRPQ